jgi:hypothetical protein
VIPHRGSYAKEVQRRQRELHFAGLTQQAAPTPPRSTVGATDRGALGDGPPTAPSQLPRERPVAMSPNHPRHVSEGPARPVPHGWDAAAATSSTRQFTHCSQISIHGHYRRRYRASGSPQATTSGNMVFTPGKNLRPRPGEARRPSEQGFLTSRVVCDGNRQNVQAIADAEGPVRNTFTFNTGTTCRQWRGRRRCVPRCGVS